MEKKLNTGLLITALILILGSVGSAVAGAVLNFNVGNAIALVAEILCGAAAFIYFVKGYKKDSAKYFRMVFFVIAGSYIVEAFSDSLLSGGSGLWLAFMLVVYGNNLILAVSKDVGKIPSLCLGIFNAVVYAVILIMDVATAGTAISTILFSASWVASALVALVMITAKYIDKENRNTK